MSEDESENPKPKRKYMIDPYTGEAVPVAEDADKFDEVIPTDPGNRAGENYLLREEDSMDHFTADADADALAEQSARYTDDEEIKRDFEERQQLAAGGRSRLEEELEEHHSKSPRLSGGDLDAAWELADSAGEETIGGTAPTPDQDVVDEIGEAAGLTYTDDEELNSDKKILERDRHRWELDPRSAEDDEDDVND